MASSSSASSDPLLDLLTPHVPNADSLVADPLTHSYLSRLNSLPLSSILTTEPSALQSSHHSLNVSIQSLSARSHKALIASSQHLSTLPSSLETIRTSLTSLTAKSPSSAGSIAALESTVQSFTQTFHKDNSPAIAARSKAHLLARNLDRLLDILELPTLLSSSISSGNYPTSLDILAHVRRLVTLYPDSPTILSIARECEAHQRTMISNLVAILSGSLKLPMAMKTVGWLKRAVPEMAENEDTAQGLFLVCRLSWVEGLFQALDPLRELAEEEREQRLRRERRKQRRKARGERLETSAANSSSEQHTERYLKRWIEIFREQSFAVVSMCRSIFPNTTTAAPGIPSNPPFPTATTTTAPKNPSNEDDIDPPPPPLATFILHLLHLLETTLKTYLPSIQDKSSRESLLTQVLYAAGSLGRLGGDFSGVVATLGMAEDGQEEEKEDGEQVEEKDKDEGEEEWVEVMKKHRVLASRLEQLAAGGGVAIGVGAR